MEAKPNLDEMSIGSLKRARINIPWKTHMVAAVVQYIIIYDNNLLQIRIINKQFISSMSIWNISEKASRTIH
jgi:hypothetical protein